MQITKNLWRVEFSLSFARKPACDIFTTQIWRVTAALTCCASCPCVYIIKTF